MKQILLLAALFSYGHLAAQRPVQGIVLNSVTAEAVAGATVRLSDSSHSVACDANGKFVVTVSPGITLVVSATGYEPRPVDPGEKERITVLLISLEKEMDAIVVTGTLKAVKRSDSPVAVEVYTPQFFKKNPSPSIFESLQNVNGVRPQLNCSVCNTGDIHINGLEGPYTMVTIDGMPIVSSLASVYGLFGIPTQLVDRIEIVKGPASGLYGPEAIGGLINIITRSPEKAPLLTANFMTTSWLEHNLDIGTKFKLGKKAVSLLGVNYFNYQHLVDRNDDHFTDVTLQHRVSVFNKLSFTRRNNRVASLAARYFYEDRWGGDLRWNKHFRGGDSLYGESIYTNRWELIGNYQLPVEEKIIFSFSTTAHDQNSYYGKIPYRGKQKISFGQFTWDKQLGIAHSMLAGIAGRYNYYDDNSTATLDTLTEKNNPENYFIPGLFMQDEWKLNARHLLLWGLRYDHHPIHKGIITPRLAWKWMLKEKQVIRVNAGTGFRVVNLFTEDHAALTGARSVEIREKLEPEKSYNINLNYTQFFRWNRLSLNIDASVWYSHFTNQIIADYDTDPNKIIYNNLQGFSSSKGATINLELNSGHRFKSLIGITVQDVRKVERNSVGEHIPQQLALTEKWSGVWSASYSFPAEGITIDYTGNIYGPMRLPLLSATDPRPPFSPVWSIQNIQFTKLCNPQLEVFAGMKNLLNWTPTKNTPFIIARAEDPFDKKLQYDTEGRVLVTADNPYGLSFDPNYVYAPNQPLRFFAGARFNLKK